MQDFSDRIRLLQATPLFAEVGPPHIEAVAEALRLERFAAGKTILRHGDAGEALYLIVSGTVSVFVRSEDFGVSLQIAKLGPGQHFGEMSLLTGEPRSATIRAEGDCEVLVISKKVMAEVLRASLQCLTQLSELLAKRRLEGDNIVKGAIVPDDLGKKEREYRASFLDRLRTVFEL